jgi:hypothetical protein
MESWFIPRLGAIDSRTAKEFVSPPMRHIAGALM